MTSQTTLHNVSLEQVCEEQGQPFRWLSMGDPARVRILKSLTGATREPFRSALMYCGRVTDAVVFGKSYVTDKPGRAVFLHQGHRSYFADEFKTYYVNDILLDRASRPIVEPECCFLGGISGGLEFFGHFIFEFLYRLAAFKECGLLEDLPVVVYEGVPDSWISYIELFGVSKDRILRIPQRPASMFRNVWVAACPNSLGYDHAYAFWDDGIHRLRQTLLRNALAETHNRQPGPKRVFIGRRDAQHRKLINEDAVWAFLSSMEFDYPEFAGKPAAEQIRLVSGAEVLVVVPGSGSSMTQFAPSSAVVIEFLPPHLVGGLGPKGFAAVLGQTYERIPAKVVSRADQPGLNNDLEVDIELVRRAVEAAVAHQRIVEQAPRE